jgi:hypothetical protein
VLDRLRSAYHGWSLAVSERTAHVRGPRPETPAGRLPSLPAEAEHRIGTLQRRYGVAFEQRLGARSALQNYEYLDWLDAAFAAWDLAPPRPAELHDVGCGGFAYCHALQSFFAPVRLVGIDVEGHRRLRGGVNRRERVLGHLVDVPSAEFVVADYTRWSRRADFVTTFFPFVTPAPLLAWRLPLALLRPAALFAAMHANLVTQGRLLLASHSAAEHATAAEFARAAGFVRVAVVERPRLAPATPGEPPVVLSLWQADGRAQDEGA